MTRFYLLCFVASHLTLATLFAHPGHGPMDHGPAHLLTSPYHLVVLSAISLACFGVGMLAKKTAVRRVFGALGICGFVGVLALLRFTH